MYGTAVNLRDMSQGEIRPFEDAVPEARADEEVPAVVEPPRNSRQVLPADTVEFRRHTRRTRREGFFICDIRIYPNILGTDEPQRSSGLIG